VADLKIWNAAVIEVAEPEIDKDSFLLMQGEVFETADAMDYPLRVDVVHADYEPPYRFTLHFHEHADDEGTRKAYLSILSVIADHFT